VPHKKIVRAWRLKTEKAGQNSHFRGDWIVATDANVTLESVTVRVKAVFPDLT